MPISPGLSQTQDETAAKAVKKIGNFLGHKNPKKCEGRTWKNMEEHGRTYKVGPADVETGLH